MAISKGTVYNKARVNKPQAFVEMPVACPEHQPCPEPHCCHHHDHPHPAPEVHIYKSYTEAVAAANLVFLRPGEARTEFYQEGNTIHCIVAIGNILPNKGHLILCDSGSDMSLTDQLNDVIITLNRSIYNMNTSINNIVTNINASLNEYNTNFQSLKNYVMRLDQYIQELNAKHEADIEDLQNQIDAISKDVNLVPITDASIESLFRYDIYTVNLCCHTCGGYIKIMDDIDFVDDGIDVRGQYKTYRTNDEVTFTAVENKGYEFYMWYKDGQMKTNNETVKMKFEEEDINVVGTLLDGIERDLLHHGWTAVFKELPTITRSVIVTNEAIAEISGDNFTVVDLTNDMIDDKWFHVGDKLRIEAKPVQGHEFVSFVINGTTYNTPIIERTFNESITIYAYFKEVRYVVEAEPNVAEYGEVLASPEGYSFIVGKDITLSAIPATTNVQTEFVNWTIDPEFGTPSVYSMLNPVKIHVENDLHLVANFKIKTAKFQFVGDKGYISYNGQIAQSMTFDVNYNKPLSESINFDNMEIVNVIDGYVFDKFQLLTSTGFEELDEDMMPEIGKTYQVIASYVIDNGPQ